MMSNDRFHIRVMEPQDVALAIEWAAAEGWNPGHADSACFAKVDPQGLLLGELDGKAATTISTVNYDARFAFLGFYIVRPDLRGRGLGLRAWNAAIAHAGQRTIGLDGVVAQQENYKKSGFVLAYRNIRFGGIPERPTREPPGIVPLTAVPFAAVQPTTQGSSLRHAKHSCAAGPVRPAISGARSCATAGSRPEA
jgi:GNAT superfamily N-acetyltransferase